MIEIKIREALFIQGLPPTAIEHFQRENTFPNPKIETLERLGKWTGREPKFIKLWGTCPNLDGGPPFLTLPRGYLSNVGHKLKEMGMDFRYTNLTVEPRMPPDYPCLETGRLDDFQEEAVWALLAFEYGVMQSPTGSGKGNMLLSAAARLKTTALVIVHTQELLRQTVERCMGWLGVEPGVIHGTKFKLAPITVAMAQTLAKRDLKALGIADYFGAVIVDECLDPSTGISTPSGIRALGDLNAGDEVCTPFGTSSKITRLWHVRKEAREYSSGSGHTLIASRDHKVLAREHFGDEIMAIGEVSSLFACGHPYMLPLQIDFEDYLMGWIYADGTVSKPHNGNKCYIKFGFRKPEKVALFRKWFGDCCAEFTNARGDTVFSIQAEYGHELIEKYGLLPGKKADTVEIHKSLMDTHSAGVLRGMMDADGARTQGRIVIDLASKVCRDQMHALLSYYGIDSTCQKEITRPSPKHNSRWRLTIYGDAINRYNALIGWGMRSKDWGQFASDWRAKNTRVELQGARPLGGRDLIDIEIEDNHHLFIANGLIVSNCHHAPCNTWAQVLQKMPARYKYGFSATAWRKDKMEFLMWRLMGEIRAKVTRETVEQAGRIVPAEIEPVDTNYFYSVADPSEWGTMITDLIADPSRNDLIAREVRLRMTNPEGRALILTDRIEHAKTLAAKLVEFDPALLHGGLTEKQRHDAMLRVKGGARLTVATIHLLGEGIDCPGWDLLFLPSPMSWGPRVLQALGRIVRAAPGKEKAVLVDFVDSRVSMLKNAAKSRRRLYYSGGE